jgi:hypothetical protein
LLLLSSTGGAHAQEQQASTPTTASTLTSTPTTGYNGCKAQILAADADNNDQLTRAEYATLIAALTNNEIENELPITLVAAFNVLLASSTISTSTPHDANDGMAVISLKTTAGGNDNILVQRICNVVYAALVETLGITTTDQQCFIAMTLADINRDNFLTNRNEEEVQSQEQEYGRFIARLFPRYYPTTAGAPHYQDLPDTVRAVLHGLEGDASGAIDVSGSRPGASLTDAQLGALRNVCRQVLVAVTVNPPPPSLSEPPASNTGGGAAAADAPTPAPASSSSQLPPRNCLIAITVSDVNRDDMLNTEEYVRFVNRLSGNAWVGESFDMLPVVLRANYEQLANDDSSGQIPISGSKPGQSPSPEQEEQLLRICVNTAAAIGQALKPTTAPATAPPGVLTAAPTVIPTSMKKSKKGMAKQGKTKKDMAKKGMAKKGGKQVQKGTMMMMMMGMGSGGMSKAGKRGGKAKVRFRIFLGL